MNNTNYFVEARQSLFPGIRGLKFKLHQIGKTRITPWGLQIGLFGIPIEEDKLHLFKREGGYHFPIFYLFLEKVEKEKYKIGDIGIAKLATSKSKNKFYIFERL